MAVFHHSHSLISTSTPAGRSSFIRLSTVWGVGSTMSSRRLCVRISNCSREVLSTCGDRSTVHRLMTVGNSTGPDTRAPVRRTVSTISFIERSRRLWSYALSRMRIFWSALTVTMPLLRDLRDDAGAHGAPALADREPQLLLHRHPLDTISRAR